MKKLCLMAMPFAEIKLPSIALTQLRSICSKQYKDEISIEILYLNHDFANFFGKQFYKTIMMDKDIKKTITEAEFYDNGLGDWFFRDVAFPGQEDNSEEYFNRYYPKNDFIKNEITSKKGQLRDFMEELISKYKLDENDIIGFTSSVQQQVASLAMARLIKERNPETVIVMGGPNCEYPASKVLVRNVDCVDYVFSGPGLISFPRFIGYYLKNQLDEIESINGVFTKENFAAKENSKNGCLYGEELDINHVVGLDYDSYIDSISNHFPDGDVEPMLTFETSRGCWWGEKSTCAFCTMNRLDPTYRTMSAPNAVNYINSILKYKDKCNFFIAVDSIIPPNYLEEVFPHLDISDLIHFYYAVRVDMKEHDIEQLAKHKINMVLAGVESLVTENLKLMKKGSTIFKNLRFLKNCRMNGIVVLWNFLAAVPGENDEVYNRYAEIIPLITHLPPPSSMWSVSIQKHSEYSRHPEKYNLVVEPDTELYEYVYPFENKDLADLTYFFKVKNKDEVFSLKKLKRIIKVQQMVTNWKAAWRPDNSGGPPNLSINYQDGKASIIDTRNGEPQNYPIDEYDEKILAFLNKPKRLDSFALEFPELSYEEILSKINNLKEKKLLFYDDPFYLSLVFPKQPQFLNGYLH